MATNAAIELNEKVLVDNVVQSGTDILKFLQEQRKRELSEEQLLIILNQLMNQATYDWNEFFRVRIHDNELVVKILSLPITVQMWMNW